MVRRSTLVYNLLKSEQSQEGFTEKEIIGHISNKHDIVAGKGLRKQVAMALRRGVDFGILAKKNNKFRFDLDSINTARSTIKKKKEPVSRKKKRSTSIRNNNKRRKAPTRARARSTSVPQPRVPKPPSWTVKRKNLAEEPVPKVRKVS